MGILDDWAKLKNNIEPPAIAIPAISAISVPENGITTIENSKNSKNSYSNSHEIKNSAEPEWQYNFCIAHAKFNDWSDQCPHSMDGCLLSKIINSGGNINKLRGIEVGHGIATDMVIDEWLETGEPAVAIFNNPAWLICMAEYIFKD